MKGFQILASLLLLSAFCKADESVEDQNKKLEAALEECSDAQGLTKEEAEKIPSMICTGEELDKKLSCHTACLFKKLEVMVDGEILPDEIKKSILSNMKNEETRTELEGKVEKCKNESAGVVDECDKAVQFTRCISADTEFCKKSS